MGQGEHRVPPTGSGLWKGQSAHCPRNASGAPCAWELPARHGVPGHRYDPARSSGQNHVCSLLPMQGRGVRGLCCCNQLPQMQWLQTTSVYYLTVLGVSSLRWASWGQCEGVRGLLPPEGSAGRSGGAWIPGLEAAFLRPPGQHRSIFHLDSGSHF